MNDDDELQPPIGDLLADPRTWEPPDPHGADALLAAIAAEPVRGQRGPGPSAPPDDAGPGRAARPAVPRRPSRGLRILAAAAVLVVVAALAVALTQLGGDDGDAREVALTGTELAPDASATATVEELGSGVAIELAVAGLPPAAPGTYYQAWLKSADGDLITVGTFHMRAGDETVELWAGVDLADYPTLTVTLQQEGAGQDSSGQVVLSGDLTP